MPVTFTIPSFDINLKDGGTLLHSKPVTIHVLADSTAPSANTQITVTTQPVTPQPQQPGFQSLPDRWSCPITMGSTNGVPIQLTSSNINVPTDADGHPLKVFMILTPQTTDAYVGQSIPMRIDFSSASRYRRAAGVSLPTINGSDFMMESHRPAG